MLHCNLQADAPTRVARVHQVFTHAWLSVAKLVHVVWWQLSMEPGCIMHAHGHGHAVHKHMCAGQRTIAQCTCTV